MLGAIGTRTTSDYTRKLEQRENGKTSLWRSRSIRGRDGSRSGDHNWRSRQILRGKLWLKEVSTNLMLLIPTPLLSTLQARWTAIKSIFLSLPESRGRPQALTAIARKLPENHDRPSRFCRHQISKLLVMISSTTHRDLCLLRRKLWVMDFGVYLYFS